MILARRQIVPFAAGLLLSRCATVETVARELTPSVEDTAALYGIAKGVAEVACLAVPALGPIVGVIIAAADPLVARMQADATLATQVTAHSHTLLLASAPAVKVTSSI